MNKQLCVAVLLLALASCGPRHEPEQPTRNVNAPVIPAPSAPPAVTNSAAPAPQPEPPARTPTVDPKSTDVQLQGVERAARGNRAQRKGVLFKRMGHSVGGLEQSGEVVSGERRVGEAAARASLDEHLAERHVRPAGCRQCATRHRQPPDGAGHGQLKIGSRLEACRPGDLAPDLGR